MLVSPLIAGIVASGPAWVHLPLTVTWIVGYFAFFATSLWLKAARKERYVTPMRTYLVATALAGLITVMLIPRLVLWCPVFAALSAVALVEASRRRDRSVLSGLSTIIAAALMTFVVMDAAGGLATRDDVGRAAFLTLAQVGYLVGVLLYVRTMIRERDNPAFLRISAGWHVGIVVIAAAWAVWHPWVWLLVGVYALLLARAAFVPGRPLKPKQVGLAELPLHALVLAAALVAVR